MFEMTESTPKNKSFASLVFFMVANGSYDTATTVVGRLKAAERLPGIMRLVTAHKLGESTVERISARDAPSQAYATRLSERLC